MQPDGARMSIITLHSKSGRSSHAAHANKYARTLVHRHTHARIINIPMHTFGACALSVVGAIIQRTRVNSLFMFIVRSHLSQEPQPSRRALIGSAHSHKLYAYVCAANIPNTPNVARPAIIANHQSRQPTTPPTPNCTQLTGALPFSPVRLSMAARRRRRVRKPSEPN